MNYKKNILIYEPADTGHHPEFINNLWTYLKNSPPIDKKILFAIHPKIVELYNLESTKIQNVEIILVLKYYSNFSEIKNLANRLLATDVIIMTLNPLFMSLAFDRFKFNITGIVFNPFNTNYENYSIYKRFYKELLYLIVSRRNRIKRIFILNDLRSAVFLNNRYKVNKYMYLPDPIPFYKKEKLPSSIILLIKKRTTILHFGTMSDRKGTQIILDSIELLPPEYMKDLAFLFIGKPCNKNFKDKINEKILLYKKIYPSINIYYYSDFVSVGMMEAYFEISDLVLIPYISNNMSSGVLGHAVKYNKPIVSGKGLLGEIVCDNNLGFSINVSKNAIRDVIVEFLKYGKVINGESYVNEHSIENFSKIILND